MRVGGQRERQTSGGDDAGDNLETMPVRTCATSSTGTEASSLMRRGRRRSIPIWPRGGQIRAQRRRIFRLRPLAAPEPIEVGDGGGARPARGGEDGGSHRNPHAALRPPPRPACRSSSAATGERQRGRGGGRERMRERAATGGERER